LRQKGKSYSLDLVNGGVVNKPVIDEDDEDEEEPLSVPQNKKIKSNSTSTSNSNASTQKRRITSLIDVLVDNDEGTTPKKAKVSHDVDLVTPAVDMDVVETTKWGKRKK